jgi:hypothetical protein
MPNPFNPLDWIKSAQDWFTRTERSSGFRPYLIFLIIHLGFVVVLLTAFPESDVTTQFAMISLYISMGAFVLLFAVKAFQDPDFCRSEKHIENIKRIEMMEEKGDAAPQPVDVTTTELMPNSTALPSKQEDGK